MYNFRFLINLFSSQRVMRGYGFSVWKCSVDKTFWKNLGVARFWGWVAAGVASVEDSQWLSCTGHSHFQIALHPSQAKDEPITELGAAPAKMFLWKNGNSRKRRREHGDNVGTEIGGGNLRETAREYQGQRGRRCSTAEHIFPKTQSLWKAHAKAEEKSKGAPKGTNMSWLANTATPPPLDPFPRWKHEAHPVAVSSWEVSCLMWSQTWEKEWCVFPKCFNDFFSFFAFVSQYLKE